MLTTGYYQLLYGQPPLMINGVATTVPPLIGPIIPCVAYPAKGQDVLKLEEGYRTREVWTVFVPIGVVVQLGDPSTQRDPDCVLLPAGSNNRFQFMHAEHWEEAAGFAKFLAVKADPRLYGL